MKNEILASYKRDLINRYKCSAEIKNDLLILKTQRYRISIICVVPKKFRLGISYYVTINVLDVLNHNRLVKTMFLGCGIGRPSFISDIYKFLDTCLLQKPVVDYDPKGILPF